MVVQVGVVSSRRAVWCVRGRVPPSNSNESEILYVPFGVLTSNSLVRMNNDILKWCQPLFSQSNNHHHHLLHVCHLRSEVTSITIRLYCRLFEQLHVAWSSRGAFLLVSLRSVLWHSAFLREGFLRRVVTFALDFLV